MDHERTNPLGGIFRDQSACAVRRQGAGATAWQGHVERAQRRRRTAQALPSGAALGPRGGVARRSCSGATPRSSRLATGPESRAEPDNAAERIGHFKNLILDYARQALEFFAPDEALDLERARITPLRQEQLKERLGERFRELDVPLLVEWPDGSREAVVFVLEEETAAGRFNIHRLVHYCADIAELLATDRVVPVVVFLGRAASAPQEMHLGGERHTYLSFRYLSCSLADLPAERYFDSDNLVCRLNLPNMAHTPAHRLEVYARALRGLFTLETDPERQAKYLDFIDIYTALDDTEQAQFRARYPEEVDTVSSFAQRFTEKGIQQGVQQGIQQGIQQGLEQGLEKGRQQGQKQGEAAMLLRQLTRKFGPKAAEAHRPRIEAAGAETLLAWSERILDAESPEDIFRPE